MTFGITPRRDFLVLATGAMAAVGGAISVWPLIDGMNPASDIRALSSVAVDIEPIRIGQRITVKWRGQPIFIGHRTPREIARAENLYRPEYRFLEGNLVQLG